MHCMTTQTVANREAARRSNGEFGEQTFTEPEVELGLGQRDMTRDEAKKFLEDVTRFASQYARARGQFGDRDDIVGDTIVDVLAQQRAGKDHIASPAFLNRATGAVSSRYIDPGVHHTTLTGRKRYKSVEADKVQELGRELTVREQDALADEVRLSFPPGRRPTQGFHRKRWDVSLDAPTREGSTSIGDTLAADENVESYSLATSAAAAAMDALEGDEPALTKAEARENAWALIIDDGPQASPGAIADEKALRATTRALKEDGGAAALARDYLLGDTTPEQNRTLFAPFGSLTQNDEERVANTFRKHAPFADRLWASAAASAVSPQGNG